MLLPGTQMHLVTFLFVCIEIVILFYLIIYRLARPDDKTAYLNIILIFLLITYNVTGGLLPDKNLPGSFFVQMSIAYATGFITPCYFPYYVHKAFGLEKMRFHAYKGVYLFLILPYITFVLVFAVTENLDTAKNLLALAVVYAVWVIFSLVKAIRYKYRNSSETRESREEIIILFLSITSWVGVPVIDYFNFGQAFEASITNFGFLLLFSLQVKRHIKKARIEHQRLIDSEQQLLNWNTDLRNEVSKRTKELEKINEQRTNSFVNLAHETKTPLTLINNYFDEYMTKVQPAEELNIVKENLNKLSSDIVNLFDLEKFNKGFAVYNHELISDFSIMLKESIFLFRQYAAKRNIELVPAIEDGICIKADPLAINRTINNLVENAIKFSNDGGAIKISLSVIENRVYFAVKDNGSGIPTSMQGTVFEPYYQIANKKRNSQGMGLGLPIVKKIIDDLNGEISILSNPDIAFGTEMRVQLRRYILSDKDAVASIAPAIKISATALETKINLAQFDTEKQTVLIVEDNTTMLNYLHSKLQPKYNIQSAQNGSEAVKILNGNGILPHLIVSDIMMDKMDGFEMAQIISRIPKWSHIPIIFLTAKNTSADKLQGLKLGAVDYIQKPFHIVELLQKIESLTSLVAKQKKTAIEELMQVAQNSFRINSGDEQQNTFETKCRLFKLSTREIEISRLIGMGLSYKAIAEKLFVSERTVNKHSENIFEKVRVKNKLGLLNKLGFVP
jgi:signal transduction histidine kinase/DNA-binding NarL/FixJ family response regulator